MAENITTPADQLLEFFIKNNKKMNVEEIADKLGMPIEQVEEWADILEEHGLISVEYSPLHGMAIKPKIHELKQEELEQRVAEVKPKLKSSFKLSFPKITLPSLKRKQQMQVKHEVIRGKFEHASERMAELPKANPEVVKLKQEKVQLQKDLDEMKRHVTEIHKAPPKEVKKQRFVHFVKKTEKRQREMAERTDMFTRKIIELEKIMERHKERRH